MAKMKKAKKPRHLKAPNPTNEHKNRPRSGMRTEVHNEIMSRSRHGKKHGSDKVQSYKD